MLPQKGTSGTLVGTKMLPKSRQNAETSAVLAHRQQTKLLLWIANSRILNSFDFSFTRGPLALQVLLRMVMKYLAMASSTRQVGPACTREEAAELLESLRGEYRALPPNKRWLVQSVLQAVDRSNRSARRPGAEVPMLAIVPSVATAARDGAPRSRRAFSALTWVEF